MGENTIVPMLQVFSILTTASFALQVNNGRYLISDTTFNNLKDKVSIVKGASGFSLFFFVIKDNLKTVKFATPTGRLYSMLQRETMPLAINYAKQNLFGKGRSGSCPLDDSLPGGHPYRKDSDLPEWMRSLDAEDDTLRAVDAVCTRLEKNSGRAMRAQSGGNQTPTRSSGALSISSNQSSADFGPRRKRARTEGSAGSGSDVVEVIEQVSTPELSTEDRYRLSVISNLRSMWTDYLNRERCSIRAKLHKDLFFLREFIENNFETGTELVGRPGLDAARRAGYCYEFNDEDIDEELEIPADITRTRWDIDVAKREDNHGARDLVSGRKKGSNENAKKLESLRHKFKCLEVTLKWKRRVIKDPAVAEERDPSETNYLHVSQKLSLHTIAVNSIVEFFKPRDTSAFLATSALSIRTVHVTAIAIRALLRKSLYFNLSPMEIAALGNAAHIKHSSVGPADDIGTSRMADDDLPGGKSKRRRTLPANLAKKLTISKADYDEIMLRNASTRAAAAARTSEGGDQTALSEEISGAGTRSTGTVQELNVEGLASARARSTNASWAYGD